MTGRAKFAEMIQERFGKTSDEAEHIIDIFLEAGAAKYNSVGQLQVVHGAFLEPDVIERALADFDS